jgi:hypothetical protein
MLQPQIAAVQRAQTAIDVELVRLPPPDRVHGRSSAAKATREPLPPSVAAHASQSNGAAAVDNRIVIRPNSAATTNDQPSIDPGLASALRTSSGCSSANFLHLTPSEQQACERLRHDRQVAMGTSEFGMDASKKAWLDEAKNRDAYWEHPFSGIKVLKDCRPRAGTGPAGDSGDVTIGLKCAIPF